MLGLIDTHTHIETKYLRKPLSEVRKSYLEAGVTKIINTSADMEGLRDCKKYTEFDEIHLVLGVHPECVYNLTSKDYEEIEREAKDNRCIAVGEIGLDYHYGGDKEAQKAAFIKQILIADKIGKPIVIHSRDACKDTLDILYKYKDNLKKGFLMHCFSESLEVGRELVKIGGYFSFGGALTFKNSKRKEVLKGLPIDRIMFETDSPYMTPEPHRGEPNESANVKYVYEFAARELGVSLDELIKIVDENVNRLFKI